jgi:clan AA aspartic protease
MIVGVVTPDREPIIQIVVHGPSSREHQSEALVDTGFDGWLTLPAETIERLELQWRRRGRALLADGSECVFDIYEGALEWDGAFRRIAIDEADTAPLAGMSLLDGYELNVQVREGGSVTIKLLSA